MKKNHSKIKWFKKTKHLLLFLPAIPLAVCLILFYLWVLKDLPSPTKLTSNAIPQSTRIYDRNDVLLYTIYAQKNSTSLPLKDIPKTLQQATIAIEDKDFYRHGAVDLRGIIRALYTNIRSESIQQGGSTLTQQLVKTSLLSPEQTVTRKVKEVLLSFATEALYPKDKIIEMYLNQVPYGGTAYGVEAASMTYFNKHAKEVNLAEAAFLAGLPEAPSIYSPFGTHPELAKQRQELVLQKMYEQGYITKKQLDSATKQKLTFRKLADTIEAPHFVLYVKNLLVNKYGQQAVEQGGLTVKTSLDLTIQNFAQDAVATEVAELKNLRVSNGAALITNPSTGEILAMIGSRGYFSTETDGNVNITLAKLQPGSSIKPINYAVGLLNGYSAATPFIDAAVCFPNPGQAPYCPKNYDNSYSGLVQMRDALGNSLNIPAVQMLKMNTLEAMIATASAMGISTFTDPSRYGLSLTLGGGEVTMLDMATAFGVFANQGYRIDLHPVLKVTDRNGKVLEEYEPPPSPIFGKKVLPPGVAFIISHILQDNNARLKAFGANSQLRIPGHVVSVKTGTTNDYRDNWTIGYTPNLLVAAWVGNNDHTPMSGVVSGVTGAAPIWNTLMSYLLEGKKTAQLRVPSDVVQRYVCTTTGELPAQGDAADKCPTRAEYFVKGITPKKSLTVKREAVFIDKATGDLAKPGQTENVEPKEETIVTDAVGGKYCISCPKPSASPTP